MKRFLSLLSLVMAAGLSAQTAPQPSPSTEQSTNKDDKKVSSVTGMLSSLVSAEPVRKAKVTLSPSDSSKTAYTAMSDNDGKFTIEKVEAGRYTLKAERQGFVTQNYGAKKPSAPGTTLDVKADKEMAALSLKLTPQGVIAGRVLDDENEPMAGLTVTVLRHQYMFGHQRLLPAGLPVQTNDLGEYRVANLEPGQYYVSSTAQKMMQIETGTEKSSGKGFEEGFVSTYFPNVPESQSASAVDVGPGAEVRGIDIHLKKTRVVRVSGKILNAQGEPVKAGVLMVYRRENGGMSTTPSSLYVAQGEKGTYELRNIPPGQYMLMAMSTGDVQNMKISTVNIDVGEQPITDRTITIGGGFDVPVNAKYLNLAPSQAAAGKNEAEGLGNVRIVLQQDDNPMASLATALLDKDGKGTMKTVNPDRYRITLAGLPPGAYLKSAMLGSQDTLENGLDIRGGVNGSLEITIAAPAPELSGYARNEKNEAFPGAIVTLVPKKTNPHRGDLARTITADQNGRYNFRGIVPGEYKLFAWEDIESGAAEDEEFLKPFDKVKKEVSLAEGAKSTQDVTVIAKATVQEEKARRQ